MQFILKGSPQPRNGRFKEDGRGGLHVIDDASGTAFASMAVSLVVVDDVAMGDLATKAGFKVHTPLSANLELGVTGAGRQKGSRESGRD